MHIGYLTIRPRRGKPPMYYYGIHKVESRETLDPYYIGSGSALGRDIARFGKGAFRRAVLVIMESESDADAWERRMITEREVNDPLCYNQQTGGRGNWHHSDRTKAKMRKPMSADHKAKIGAAHKGRPKSAEHKAKISAGQTGKKHSAETKEKISAARKGKKTGPLSAETKAKIGAAHKGKTLSPEARAKISEAHKGKPLSAKHRAKISAGLKRTLAALKK